MFHPPVHTSAHGLPAARAREEASRALSESRLLRADVERLLLIAQALWDVLKEKHGYTDGELVRRVEAIDLRDGMLDGRVAPSEPLACPRCSRVLSKRRPVCLYCGQAVETDPFVR